MTTLPAARLMRKRRRQDAPVTPQSVALFRLGEICNNHCPMCSNSGREAAWKIAGNELLQRVDRLHGWGFRRVVVTGGEPSVHPAFWSVVAQLQARGIAWDINTHGRTFADADATERALSLGLERAIVSFHSHVPEASVVISGMPERGHAQTVAGIERLVAAGVPVMLNLVLCKLNLDHLAAWVQYCSAQFAALPGASVQLKVCFPYHGGKGGDWAQIQLRYTDVAAAAQAARRRADELGVELLFESFPNCVINDPLARNLGRSGFGETHYLEDLRGETYYAMRHIESSLTVYGPQCRDCSALARCPGVTELYARTHGTDELVPLRPAGGSQPV